METPSKTNAITGVRGSGGDIRVFRSTRKSSDIALWVFAYGALTTHSFTQVPVLKIRNIYFFLKCTNVHFIIVHIYIHIMVVQQAVHLSTLYDKSNSDDPAVFLENGVIVNSISVKIVLLLSLLMKRIINIIPVLELIILSRIITGW